MIEQMVKILNISPGSIILMLLAVVIILAGIWLILAYNRLTRARIRIDNSWSQVSVQLKMRADLVPNLVETVRGYARHEQETLNQVMETRSRYLSAQTSEGAIKSSSELGGWVHRLLAVAEQYPDLKADENYRQLQTQLSEIEGKIALSRQFYNDAVMLYNRLVEVFPSRMVASLFGFEKKTYIEYEPEDMNPPSVQFS